MPENLTPRRHSNCRHFVKDADTLTRKGAGNPAGMGDARESQTMKLEDDRTEAQKRTHFLAVVARDKFMSGWGGARGGASRAAWAIDPRGPVNPDRVENWVKSRSEMKNVNLVDLRTYRPPGGTAHFHVYVVEDSSHPAARY